MKTVNWAPLPSTTITEVIEHRKVELVPAKIFGPFVLSCLFGMRRYSESYGNRNMDSNLATKPSAYNLFYLHNVLGQWSFKTCGSGQLIFGLISGTCI